jgi:AcrR family transcriptional regulator
MPKVSAEYRASRREHILQSARRCFLRNGFHATTMQDIFAESGMSAGAVYRYFASKDDVVLAIAEDSLHDVMAAIGRVGEEPHASLGDALAAGVDAIKSRDEQDNLTSLAIQVWAEAIRNPALAEKFVRLMTRSKAQLAEFARRHQQRGELPGDASADGLATVLAAVLPGYIVQRALLGGESVSDTQAALRALWPEEHRK